LETGTGKDAEEPAGEGFVSPPAHNRRLLVGTRRFLLGVLVPVLGSAAGLVAGLAALMYVLGLLALWIPIHRTYTHDLAAAWYAASLVPNTVVAGIGAGQFLATPLALVATVLVGVLVGGSLTLYIIGPLVVFVAKRLRPRARLMFYLCVLLLASAGIVWRISLHGGLLRGLIIAAVGLLLTVASILFLLRRSLFRQGGDSYHQNDATEKSRERDSRGAERAENRELIAFFSFLFGAFYLFIVAVSATLHPPPLPTASINGESHIEGKLLAHNDGFWYVFHRDEKKKPWRLVAVPDSKVKTVEVLFEGR
jgi:hypothetical protein